MQNGVLVSNTLRRKCFSIFHRLYTQYSDNLRDKKDSVLGKEFKNIASEFSSFWSWYYFTGAAHVCKL